jgi:hypothetical protein
MDDAMTKIGNPSKREIVMKAIFQFPGLGLRLLEFHDSPYFGDYQAIMGGTRFDLRVITNRGLPWVEVGSNNLYEWWDPDDILIAGNCAPSSRHPKRLESLEEQLSFVAANVDVLARLLSDSRVRTALRAKKSRRTQGIAGL